MNTKAALAVLCVFIGCGSNGMFLELLVKEDPGSGNLVNFAQFLFISLEGFLITLRCGTKKSIIPIREYVMLVIFFFAVSTINNVAFNFNISMTLHLIFRSGSLMANMILGMVLMGKRYNPMKYLSVAMISVGITVCTIASGKDVGESSTEPADGGFSDYFWWVIGISILTAALFISARMGLYQEVIFKKYGKHPREALFFTHCLPLPWYLLMYSDLATHMTIASNSVPMTFVGLTMPSMWWYLLGNVLTQYVCINSVFVLTTECASLTVTLVVTLRKFLSLLVSIYYFGNPFTAAHWFGTFCVFFGTLVYSDVLPMPRTSKDTKKKD